MIVMPQKELQAQHYNDSLLCASLPITQCQCRSMSLKSLDRSISPQRYAMQKQYPKLS